MKEVWRNIVGYEELYQVSNFGRVKRLAGKGCRQERILKPQNKNGYLRIHLYKEGKMKNFLIHRLVGMAFPDMVDWNADTKGKPVEELTINHKNEFEKANNHVSNLEWITLEGNINYGTHNERSAKARSKIVSQKTLDGELVKIWPSVMEIQRQTGWRHESISACCRGEHKSYKGYLWEYV